VPSKAHDRCGILALGAENSAIIQSSSSQQGRSMRTLITGGAGFIGSHLSERLLASGARVTIIDDLSTGSMENIAGVTRDPNLEYHIDSIFNRRLMAELVDMADVIFHFAAAAGTKRIAEYPAQT